MDNEPSEPNSLPDVEHVESVIREAAAVNPFARIIYRASRGLPKQKKAAVLAELTVKLIELADLITVNQKGGES